MADRSLRDLYEDPSTPLSSGLERAERQAAMLGAIVRTAGRPVRGIDLGCGDGMATALALSACRGTGDGIWLAGLDWSIEALGQARQRAVPVVRATAETPGLPLAGRSVDVVIMSEILEHLVDPDAALSEVRRVLVPGGHLLLSTPNLAAWYNRVLLALGVQPLFTEVSLRGIYGRPGSQVVGHLRIFTRRALVGLLRAQGFVDISVAGAPYHDVPVLFKPLDRLLCRTPGLASILLVEARTPS